jgi:hypothetical protein
MVLLGFAGLGFAGYRRSRKAWALSIPAKKWMNPNFEKGRRAPRLALEADQAKLDQTIARLKPRMLVLYPSHQKGSLTPTAPARCSAVPPNFTPGEISTLLFASRHR